MLHAHPRHLFLLFANNFIVLFIHGKQRFIVGAQGALSREEQEPNTQEASTYRSSTTHST